MARKSGTVTLALVVLLVVFVVDAMTVPSLVLAILLNVSIALSSLALSQRTTFGFIALALAANAGAGVVNAVAFDGTDGVAVMNRVFAGFSYLLVGYLGLRVRDASARETERGLEARRIDQERTLRRLLEDLSGPLAPGAFLGRAAMHLRAMLEAQSVVIAGIDKNRFAPPLVAAPDPTVEPLEGTEVPMNAAKAPSGPLRVFRTRLDHTPVLVGRWRRRDASDLLVLASHVTIPEAEVLLSEAMRVLEPALERAVLLERLGQRQDELARRNMLIRDLVYAFSHDLRTPLTANAMNMKLALDGSYGELDEGFRRALENGLRANQDLLELADELLLVARLESGDAITRHDVVDLRQLLEDSVARLGTLLEGNGLDVRLEAPASVFVLGSAGELRRVLQNLLDNAAHHSPPGASIDLRLAQEGDAAVIEVRDRGAGVSDAVRSRLFERFSSGRAGGGSGLGLYLAKGITTAHGGQIGFEPRAGGGSVFSVRLPLHRAVDEVLA